MSRLTAWVRNPWSRARFLWVIAIAYVVWTLLPVIIAVVFSFNSTRSLTSWQGFSTRWYFSDVSSVWKDHDLRRALIQIADNLVRCNSHFRGLAARWLELKKDKQ